MQYRITWLTENMKTTVTEVHDRLNIGQAWEQVKVLRINAWGKANPGKQIPMYVGQYLQLDTGQEAYLHAQEIAKERGWSVKSVVQMGE